MNAAALACVDCIFFSFIHASFGSFSSYQQLSVHFHQQLPYLPFQLFFLPSLLPLQPQQASKITSTDLVASSFAGITKSMFEGSELVSTIANTGIPRRLASRTAMFSFNTSTNEQCRRQTSQISDRTQVLFQLSTLTRNLKNFSL